MERKQTIYAYDGTTSHLTSTTDPLGNVAMTNTYDSSGRALTQKDAKGLTTGQQTAYQYGTADRYGNRTTTVTYPAISFDATWNPTVADTYDSQARLTTRASKPVSGNSSVVVTETFTYDPATNLVASFADGRGNTTNFCYDTAYDGTTIAGSTGNLTRVIAPQPAAKAARPVTLSQYDAKNNLLQVVPPKGVASGTTVTCTTSFSASSTSAYATSYGYDATQTKLVSMTGQFTDPDFGLQTATTTYFFDDDTNKGRVTRMVSPRGNAPGANPATYTTTLAYFGAGVPEAGMLQSVTAPATADVPVSKTTYDYDLAGRLTSSVDPLGNAAGAVPSDHTSTFTYDNDDRLRFAKAPPPTSGGSPLTTEFRYDAAGNRIVAVDANQQVTTYGYDSRNLLAQVQQSKDPWTDPAAPPANVITTSYT